MLLQKRRLHPEMFVKYSDFSSQMSGARRAQNSSGTPVIGCRVKGGKPRQQNQNSKKIFKQCCVSVSGLLQFPEQPTRVSQNTFADFLKNENSFLCCPGFNSEFRKGSPYPSKEGLGVMNSEVLFFMAQTLDGGGKVVVDSYHVRKTRSW